MNFPRYKGYSRPNLGVVSGDYIAQHDWQYENTTTGGRVHVASKEVGRACFLLKGRRDAEQAARILKRIEQQAADEPIETAQGRKLRLLGMTATILGAGIRGARPVQTAQQGLHGEIIGQLQALFDLQPRSKKPPIDTARGERTELVGVGLLSRLAHPWANALPALPHHDERDGMGHESYDLLLSTASPSGHDTITNRGQIKACCLGLCHDGVNHKNVRKDYVPGITLISGHCDLGIARGDGEPSVKRTADLLIKEFNGKLPMHDIDLLDGLSGRLTLAMTMDDLRRMGTYGVDEQTLQSAA